MANAPAEPGGRPLRVLMLAAECAPYAKTGGLADVIGGLPKALRRLGVDARVALPLYGTIDASAHGLTTLTSYVPVPLGAGSLPASIAYDDARGFPIYFVGNERLFGDRTDLYGFEDDGERFVFFCRGALEATRVLGWRPDVVHCHDWHTGLVPNWLRLPLADDPHFERMASVFTIHNLEYQGHFGRDILDASGLSKLGFLPHPTDPSLSGVLIFMARGIRHADAVTTVSETYAREILTPEAGERLDAVLRERGDRPVGIVNGIDTEVLDPATDRQLAARFSADDLDARIPNKADLQRRAGLPLRREVPVLGMVTRLAEHKGLDIVAAALPELLKHDVQLIVLGTGDAHYHEVLRTAVADHPARVAAFLRFDAGLAQRIYGGADIFLMPSRREPCGLGQLISLRYGCVPIVRRTGGLADTVEDFDGAGGTGYVFDAYDAGALLGAIERALSTYRDPQAWRALMRRGMARDSSWEPSARRYVEVYRDVAAHKRAAGTTAPGAADIPPV